MRTVGYTVIWIVVSYSYVLYSTVLYFTLTLSIISLIHRVPQGIYTTFILIIRSDLDLVFSIFTYLQ